MAIRKRTLAAVLFLLGSPMALAMFEAWSYHAENRNNGSILVAGREREYLLYVPASYDPAWPTPLVISLHGAGMWPKAQMATSGWNALANQEAFIVVYPSAVDGAGPRVWHVDRNPGPDEDVRFLAALIDELASGYNLDPDRIYANGFSNGGGMSFVLSCRLADRIAAVGTVAAAQTLPWSFCHDPQPMPMMAFHGTADRVVPYHGDFSTIVREPFPSVEIWVEQWSRRNRCGAAPAASAVAPGVRRAEYPNCAGDADVVLYTLEGAGHTWPGGHALPEWLLGRTEQNVDATRLLWSFFRDHPRRAQVATGEGQ